LLCRFSCLCRYRRKGRLFCLHRQADRLRQGVLIAGAVSGAGVLVWTLLHWKKRRPPLAEEGET